MMTPSLRLAALKRPMAVIGLALVALHLSLALLSPWISPFDPTELVGGRAQPPGSRPEIHCCPVSRALAGITITIEASLA